MKQFKGTPAPWVWDDEGLGNSTMLVFGREYPLEMTSSANKNLIAAAPELLDELMHVQRLSKQIIEALLYSGNLTLANEMNTHHPMRAKIIKSALGE